MRSESIDSGAFSTNTLLQAPETLHSTCVQRVGMFKNPPKRPHRGVLPSWHMVIDEFLVTIRIKALGLFVRLRRRKAQGPTLTSLKPKATR